MSHALVPDKWTRPCSAKSGPRSSVLLKASARVFVGISACPERANYLRMSLWCSTRCRMWYTTSVATPLCC